MASPASAASSISTVSLYAHRGAVGGTGLVENTRAGFQADAARGVNLWETDVRFSENNYPVLTHDATLGKFNCPLVTISTVTVTEARVCTASNGQTIETLYEFTSDLVTFDASAMIELKVIPTPAQWTVLETRIASVKSRIVIESFFPEALVEASARGYDTAFLSKTAVLPSALPAGTDWYAPSYKVLTPVAADDMRTLGIKVVIWTPSVRIVGLYQTMVEAAITEEV